MKAILEELKSGLKQFFGFAVVFGGLYLAYRIDLAMLILTGFTCVIVLLYKIIDKLDEFILSFDDDDDPEEEEVPETDIITLKKAS